MISMSSISNLCLIYRHLCRSHKPFTTLSSVTVNHVLGHNTRHSIVLNRRFSHSYVNVLKDKQLMTQMESTFILPSVQTILKRLIGFDDNKVFETRPELIHKSNEVRFMTDNELKMTLEIARMKAGEQLAMPPVLAPKEDNPRILATDYELQGYIDSKYIFVDSSPGSSDQTRLIVVRETNGILREANREERYRMNQMFFPKEERLMEKPNMFSEPHLTNVLDRREYEFVLNRACLQFEPNDPEYIEICYKTYDHMVANNDVLGLQSTRHFGPFCYYLVYFKKIDELLNQFILSETIGDATDLCQLYYAIHSGDSHLSDENSINRVEDISLIKKYITEESIERPILELTLQKYEEIQRQKASLTDDIQRAHGLKT
ncbi:28S ribosomal protein S22, mitochondrial-like [Oppia nitens]|uniref:28S ribosomal protein S22, mitochondrial-like n=1 Tax=Oppia nitens TaxID=1686743 RepID=UPI0023DB35B2|nr:28S ribosomal protein S22, mitochondrial-like [Oppia nitens]